MSFRDPVKTLNKDLLYQVKQGFVPMPGGQAEPVAGAGMMTAAQVAPMGGMPPGGDPSMGGMPPGGDPSMGGGMPMDPSMGGMPPGGDPAAMGMDPSAMMSMDPAALAGAMGGEAGPADGQVTIPFSQLLELIAILTDGSVEKSLHGSAAGKDTAAGAEPKEATPKKPNNNQLIQEIHAAITGGAPAGSAPVPGM